VYDVEKANVGKKEQHQKSKFNDNDVAAFRVRKTSACEEKRITHEGQHMAGKPNLTSEEHLYWIIIRSLSPAS
jgi:hypothetical protein